MFDSISNFYDRANRLISFGFDMHWRRSLANELPNIENLKLLDIATGTGDQIIALLQKKTSIQSAIGIDISEKMLEIAKQKFKKNPSISVEFLQADAEQLPFPDQTFHLCTISFGIRNVARPLIVLSEMYRVTQFNGRCLILEFSKPLRTMIQWYLRFVMPKIGGWITKNQKPYQYLNQTIQSFASKDEFMSWMHQAQWKNSSAKNLFFGLVILYRGDK